VRVRSRAHRGLIGAIAVALVVVAGVWVALESFESERREPNTVYGAEFCEVSGDVRGCIEGVEGSMIYADVLAVRPEDHLMVVRLNVLLPAEYFADVGLGSPLVLNVAGRDVETFAVGSQQIHTLEVELDFAKLPRDCCADVIDPNTANRVTSYPFDRYDAEWSVSLRSVSDTSRPEMIPVRVSLKHAVHGYRIDAREEIPELYVLRVERSGSTVAFVVFLMVLMWGLTIGIVAMAFILTVAGRDIGPGLLGFLAAMLFAFPGIRTALPGAPPLGSLFDYAAFFWCEGIIGVTLLVLTATYLRREVESYRNERTPTPR
jgi:hypothetical protein